MKKVSAVLIVTVSIFFTICIFAQENTEREFMNVFHSISSHDIYNYVAELSSDKYNGRLTGTPEFMASAQWVADKLKEWGIKPGGDNGTYFQNFNKGYVDVKDCGSLTLHLKGKKIQK